MESLSEEDTYKWESRSAGLSLRVPLHFEVKDRHVEVGASLPLWEPPAVVFFDKWGEAAAKETEEDEVSHVLPRTVAISSRPNPEGLTLKQFCRATLLEILQLRAIAEIDGETDLHRISVGEQLNQECSIDGRPVFVTRFSYAVGQGKDWSGYVLIGCVSKMGSLVLVSVRCRSHDVYPTLYEYAVQCLSRTLSGLEASVADPNFIRHPQRAALSNSIADKGEITYRNANVAFEFSLPAYPLSLQIGKSILQSTTAHLIFSMLITIRMTPPEVGGAPEENGSAYETSSQQLVEACLGVDIEDVTKARHASILSTAEYGALKIRSTMSEFTNTKPSGTPLTNFIGNRSGVSYLWTGSLSGAVSSRFCKCMSCVTLNSNKGVAVSYFTKTGQGLFDMNLHLLQDLLKDIYFIPEGEADGPFNGDDVMSIRLQNAEDFATSFGGETAMNGNPAKSVARYVFLAKSSTNGVVAANGTQFVPICDQPDTDTSDTTRRKKKRNNEKDVSDADDFIDVSGIAHLRIEERPPSSASEDNPDSVNDAAESPKNLSKEPHLSPKADDASPQCSPAASVHNVSEVLSDTQQMDPVSPTSAPPLSPQSLSGGAANGAVYVGDEGVSLRRVYALNCSKRGAKPNSRLLSVLPSEAASSPSEVLDLSLNYFGKFFDTALYLFKFFPKVAFLILDDMNLTNADVKLLSAACEQLPALCSLSLKNNVDVSLASSKALLCAIKNCPNLVEMHLEGTSLGKDVIGLLAVEMQSKIELSESFAKK